MPVLHKHASDSFARKSPCPPKAGYGLCGMRKSELAAACEAVLDACQEGDAAALQKTLDTYAEILPEIVNARDDSGWTALHVAVSWCAEECIDLLLQTGADPGLQNNQGQNVRDLAFQLGYESLAVCIAPVPGAAEAAACKAKKAQMQADIRIITEGLPRSITITCCPLAKGLRRKAPQVP